MLIGDGITGMSNPLPCKLLSSSCPFGKKLSLINLSRQLGIPSELSSVHLCQPELAQELLEGTGMMPWFCMDKEEAMRRFSGRSLRHTYPNARSTISRIHFVHVLLAGELEAARTVDLLQLLMVGNGHIPAPAQSPSPDPQILQLPSFSSCSPLWHCSETPMGHTVGKEIKTGIYKDDAFLESLIGQMLSWGSSHLSMQALPVQQVIAKGGRVTIWDCSPKIQGHSILLTQKKNWERKW